MKTLFKTFRLLELNLCLTMLIACTHAAQNTEVDPAAMDTPAAAGADTGITSEPTATADLSAASADLPPTPVPEATPEPSGTSSSASSYTPGSASSAFSSDTPHHKGRTQASAERKASAPTGDQASTPPPAPPPNLEAALQTTTAANTAPAPEPPPPPPANAAAPDPMPEAPSVPRSAAKIDSDSPLAFDGQMTYYILGAAVLGALFIILRRKKTNFR